VSTGQKEISFGEIVLILQLVISFIPVLQSVILGKY